MNETRGNSRTKPMRGGLKGGEINSLKDSEKTNVDKVTLVIYTKEPSKTKHQIFKFCLKLQKQGCLFYWHTQNLQNNNSETIVHEGCTLYHERKINKI